MHVPLQEEGVEFLLEEYCRTMVILLMAASCSFLVMLYNLLIKPDWIFFAPVIYSMHSYVTSVIACTLIEFC